MSEDSAESDSTRKGRSEKRHPAAGIDRREFLQRGATVALGAGGALGLNGLPALADPDPVPPSGTPRVMRYSKLGRTGLEMSDISMGSSNLKTSKLVFQALDRGINYFDTAESYPLGGGGAAEEALGFALRPRRKDVIIATKAQIRTTDDRQVIMRKLEASLRRLQTDYVDIHFSHAVNDVERLKNDEWLEFVDLARRQGKIRFSGMSGHGGNLIECLDYALDNDLVQVILTAYNFGQDPAFYERFLKSLDMVALQPDLPRVLAKAHAKGVGVVAMKTLVGAKLNDLRAYEREGGTFAQAAFRWVLANPNVSGLVVTLDSVEKMDEYLGASGTRPVSAHDLELLERYALANGRGYCQHGCNQCASSCDDGVPISELLRARMYATDYGDLEMARATYRELGAAARPCLSCSHQSCTGACPLGIDIPGRTRSLPSILGIEPS